LHGVAWTATAWRYHPDGGPPLAGCDPRGGGSDGPDHATTAAGHHCGLSRAWPPGPAAVAA